jgi:diguanylate cyclase (GGDEF)-like protein
VARNADTSGPRRADSTPAASVRAKRESESGGERVRRDSMSPRTKRDTGGAGESSRMVRFATGESSRGLPRAGTGNPRTRSDTADGGRGSEPAIVIPNRRWLGHTFTIALGIIGWLIVLVLPLTGALAVEEVTPALPIMLFVLVILVARALAFRLTEGSVLSLDSAYYVAAALSVGTVEAGRLVALALTLDASARLSSKRRRKVELDGWWAELGYVLYFGGMSGGLLVVCGWLFGADSVVGHFPHEPVDITMRVVAIASALLLSHYAIQGIRLWLLGHSWRQYLRQLALPGISSEASLMPIGVVLVLLYDPDQPLGFMLLSLTYLLINFVFARLSRARHELQERVHDLEILNATGRRFSAALQLEELVEAVAREACKAIPEADAVTFVHRRAGRDSDLVMDGFDRRTDKFIRHTMSPGEGAAGWVIAHAQSNRIDDLAESDIETQADHGIRSWLGVPLFMYGDCDGVVAVQSTRTKAFTAEHQRLLESLALQIASALQNAHLYELAMVDGLTGLFVRRYFDARIEEEIERSRRYGSPFSVVMLDVDDFKKLNDTYGHLVGDRVLRAIANVIKAQMRGVDTAARYGGEEMSVILPRTEMVGAYNLAERIREAIAELRITTDDDPPRALSVTASLGIAAYPESKAQTGEDLVRRADRALYRAKKTGKNRVELFWTDDPSGLHRIADLAGAPES